MMFLFSVECRMLISIVDAFHRLCLQPESLTVVQGSTSKVGKFELFCVT